MFQFSSEQFRVKVGLAEMLKGGVIMDVTNAEQAQIAEQAGAAAVMALERVPADIRKEGGVARMAPISKIREIMQTVSIFRGNIVDVSQNTFIIEVTGGADKIDALVGLLRKYGIKEMMRTGRIVLSRGARTA